MTIFKHLIHTELPPTITKGNSNRRVKSHLTQIVSVFKKKNDGKRAQPYRSGNC